MIMRAFLLVVVLLYSGCSYIRPTAPGGLTEPRRGPVIGRLPADTGRGRLPVDTATGMPYPGRIGGGGGGLRERRICRTERVPPGWVISAYETTAQCTRVSVDNSYNLAVIATLSGYQRGDVIAICADQAIPDGWVLASGDRQRGECPGARVKEGEATALVISKW
jgi:hypothetical protein